MNYDELLWKDDTRALVELLSESCGVRIPNLPFTGRTQRRGTYYPKRKAIVVHKWTKVWIVVHEFAHYLDHIQTGRSHGRRSNDSEWHSQGFYYKLRRLTTMLGGTYPWDREYKQIARWAKAESGGAPAQETK